VKRFVVLLALALAGIVEPALAQDIDFGKAYSYTGGSSEYGAAHTGSYCEFKEQEDGLLNIQFSTDGKDRVIIDARESGATGDTTVYAVVRYNGQVQNGEVTLRRIYHAGSKGGTWVNPYTRKDGTRVKGYWRGGAPTPTINGFELKLTLEQKTVSYYFVVK